MNEALSKDLWVNSKGLILCYYDSRAQADLITEVYGVHEKSGLWIWNTVRGPAKNVNDEWLYSEDGQEFLDWIESMKKTNEGRTLEDDLLNAFNGLDPELSHPCSVCGKPTDSSTGVCDTCRHNIES